MSQPTQYAKILEALQVAEGLLKSTPGKQGARAELAGRVRDVLNAANGARGHEMLSEMHEVLTDAAEALEINDHPKAERDANEDLIRSAIRDFELYVLGDRWRVFPNDDTGHWDIYDSHDTLVTSVDSESRAKLIAAASEMLGVLRDAIQSEEGNWDGPHDPEDDNTEPSWMAHAREISDDLDGEEPSYRMTPRRESDSMISINPARLERKLRRALVQCTRLLGVTAASNGTADAETASLLRKAWQHSATEMDDAAQLAAYEAILSGALALGIRNDDTSAIDSPDADEIRAAVREFEFVHSAITWRVVEFHEFGTFAVLDSLGSVIASSHSRATAELIASAPTMYALLGEACSSIDEEEGRGELSDEWVGNTDQIVHHLDAALAQEVIETDHETATRVTLHQFTCTDAFEVRHEQANHA